MVEKVWVGKKVQVLSLKELEKNHFKEFGNIWYSRNEEKKHGNNSLHRLKYENTINVSMQKFCGKICEVAEVREEFFKIKEDEAGWNWGSLDG
ncbi:MAG: hypothetical protein BWY36_00972 [Candidatus Diapherotrites archaeon ADurb.Bin253]|nr:MAG: hypothetical protein BWY36_00972 [Candidatus Diapherotrites archaeon ADurb.Bin253]